LLWVNCEGCREKRKRTGFAIVELERINKHGRLENLQYQSQLPVGEEEVSWKVTQKENPTSI